MSTEGFNNNLPNAPPADATTTLPPAGSSWKKNIDPRVIDLIYWRDVTRSSLVLASALLLLLSFVMFSVLSVVSYIALVSLTVTITFRIYKNLMTAVQKTGDGHPFQRFLDMDISIQQSTLHDLADQLAEQLLKYLNALRRLFLVEDMFDSLKFAGLLYLLTYIGDVFNVTTLVIIAVVALFTLPKTYEVYEVEINEAVGAAQKQAQALISQAKQTVLQATGALKKQQ